MENENQTLFTQYQKPFPKPIESKLKTSQFIEAAKGVLCLLDNFGKAFAPARYDMNRNIEKISNKYEENHTKNEFLEDMVLLEKQEGKIVATDALMWLRRGLNFLLEFFEEIVRDEACQEDLSAFVKTAYSRTLKKYHGWFGSNLFNLLAKIVPQRHVLIRSIALDKENCDDSVLKDLKEFNGDLRTCVEHLFEFYQVNNLEVEAKV